MPFIGNKPTAVPLTSADLEDNIITSAKIVDGTIATADISDGAVTSVKTTGVGGTNTPAFEARNTGTQTGLGDAVWTKMTLNSETYDTDNDFDSSTNYRFTPQTAGKYFFYAKSKFQVSTYNDLRTGQIKFYKNGSAIEFTLSSFTPYGDTTGGTGVSPFTSAVIDMNGSTDYVEAYIRIDGLNSTNQSTEYNLFGGYKIIE